MDEVKFVFFLKLVVFDVVDFKIEVGRDEVWLGRCEIDVDDFG